MSDDKTKAIGTPVVTWHEAIEDLLRIVAAERDSRTLEQIRDAAHGVWGAANGRRDAIKAMRGER